MVNPVEAHSGFHWVDSAAARASACSNVTSPPESRDDRDAALARITGSGPAIHVQRRPEDGVCVGEPKRRRHHPHDRELAVAEGQRPAKDARIPPETGHPGRVTDDGDRAQRLVRRKGPSERGRDTEEPKQAPATRVRPASSPAPFRRGRHAPRGRTPRHRRTAPPRFASSPPLPPAGSDRRRSVQTGSAPPAAAHPRMGRRSAARCRRWRTPPWSYPRRAPE